jgi:release factor glutamine methyltransferase
LHKAEGWTILELLRWTTGYLGEKGCPAPRLDAEVLLAHALGLDRVGLYLNYERMLSPTELAGYRELVKRRARREPVAYIRGFKEFWSLEFEVGPAVLIPRPETEFLVEEALGLAREHRLTRIADIGTGSGAVAVVLAKELQSEVIATDRSPEALALARRNALKHAAPVSFTLADLLSPFAEGSLEMVVSNPPYVPRAEMAQAAPELSFEPVAALDGGQDGLDVVRALVAQAPRVLVKGGWLVLEVGAGQAEEVTGLFERAGFTDVASLADLAGIARVVRGRKS